MSAVDEHATLTQKNNNDKNTTDNDASKDKWESKVIYDYLTHNNNDEMFDQYTTYNQNNWEIEKYATNDSRAPQSIYGSNIIYTNLNKNKIFKFTLKIIDLIIMMKLTNI